MVGVLIVSITNTQTMAIYSQVAQLEVKGIDCDALRKSMEILNDIMKGKN